MDVVFWSGVKDSWLAWNAVRRAGRSSVWLTIYDPARNGLPVQEVEVATLDRQSESAGQSLLLQPVGTDGDYRGQVFSGLDTIARRHRIKHLVFGDLWFTDIEARSHFRRAPRRVHIQAQRADKWFLIISQESSVLGES